MKRVPFSGLLLAGLLYTAASVAQVPADAPAGTTGQCKDGSYISNATKKGACRGHQGVKNWYAGDSAAAASTAKPAGAATPAAAAAPAASAAPAAAPAPAAAAAASAATKSKPAAYVPPATAAPGGGAGQVWVNKSSKVYHCSTDKWYGKTKNGAYMSEADAKSQGYHADHGKACSG
ncbi:MAG: DUF3761 domain-containing protein [Steroidobacteraceae bacterium]